MNTRGLFILIAVFSGSIVGIVAQDHVQDPLTLRERLRDVFSKKCAENSLSIFASFELLIASNRLEEFVPTFVLTTNETVSDQIQEFCRLVQLRGYKRVKTFAKRLSSCLEEEELFLGDFITSGFNATFDNLCGESALNVSEIVETFINGNCSNNIAQLGDSLNTNCLLNLKFSETLNSTNFILKQQDVCGDIKSIKECLDNNIKVHCGDTQYSKILTKVFEPYLKWCDDHTPQNENLV